MVARAQDGMRKTPHSVSSALCLACDQVGRAEWIGMISDTFFPSIHVVAKI